MTSDYTEEGELFPEEETGRAMPVEGRNRVTYITSETLSQNVEELTTYPLVRHLDINLPCLFLMASMSIFCPALTDYTLIEIALYVLYPQRYNAFPL